MTSAISSSTSSYAMHRPDPSKLAAKLFSSLDTKNQGYIEKSDLQTAFDKIGGTGASASVDEVFKQLDGNGDGKVTEDEMSTGLKKLAEQLDSQFQQSRMAQAGGAGGMGGMPPPPPPGDDAGFTKDELQSQLDEIGSGDGQRASLISNIVSNFDQADTNGDGKVSFKEAIAYDQKSKESSTTAAATTDTGNATTTAASSSSDAAIMHRIMQLMHAYRTSGDESSQSAVSSLISATA